MEQCSQCQRSFVSTQAFYAHCRNTYDHPFCEDCDRLFSTSSGLVQHMKNAAIHRIDREEEDSTSDSDEEYDSDGEDEDEDVFCSGCNKEFFNKACLYEHLAVSWKHNWCFVCSCDFSTKKSLQQHSFSVHKGLDFDCPLCTKRFKAPSSIAQHIESGIHGVSRAQVTAAVNALEIVPTISISRRIEDNTTLQIVTYHATERAFNGTAYECYLCHHTFRTLNSLNSHVNSAAHDANEFKCPKCKGTYKLVSGLMHHIESQACGIAKFQEVENFTKDLMDQFTNRLTIK